MKPIYLHITNFTCHKTSEIDFTSFASALIIGQQNNSTRKSMGVGKTSIFKAIEYVLFNQVRDALQDKDVLLEELLLEGSDKCRVIYDFGTEDQVYRVVRSRTIRGISDLSFYRRSTLYPEQNAHTPDTDKQLWIDISSRRTQDTEADLLKIIKIHHRAFINTVYFMQFDFGSGLAAATPAHRKAILRETLDLLVYTKLEKLAKANLDVIFKDLEKKKTLVAAIGSPLKDKLQFIEQQNSIKEVLETHQKEYDGLLQIKNQHKQEYDDLVRQETRLKDQCAAIINKHNIVKSEIDSINNSIKEYDRKKKISISEANQLISSIKQLKENKEAFDLVDFSQIDHLKETIANARIQLATIKTQITGIDLQLEELNIPLPADGTCKHCRQPLSKEHREACLKDIETQIADLKQKRLNLQQEENNFIRQQNDISKSLKELEIKHKEYNNLITQLNAFDKQIISKKELYNEYASIVVKFQGDLSIKNKELEQSQNEINNSSTDQLNILKDQITKQLQLVSQSNTQYSIKEKEIKDLCVRRDVLAHNINEKQLLIDQQSQLKEEIATLEEQYAIYPLVVQAFGSTGIPSLIIQNILEDLQIETNRLLAQIHPGLQLAFQIEKIRDDGSKDDTLEIDYFLNNKPRKYGMLSGGQKVCAMFALKLGLSFLLKKILGSQINLLLLDEIDQPFDDDGVDAFANIVKYFQKEFTIMVITHRNSLKEQFNNIILVEQNQDMISHARVMSN